MKEIIKANRGKIAFGAAAIIVLVIAFIMGGKTGTSDIAVEASHKESSETVSVSSEISRKESSIFHSEVESNETASDVSNKEESLLSHNQNSPDKEKISEPEKQESLPVKEEASVASEAQESSSQERSEVVVSSESIELSEESIFVSSEEESITVDSSIQNEESEINESKCGLIIDCSTALKNEGLSDKKRRLQPENGIIFSDSSVGFKEGASVFDVLKEVCERENIRMEFSLIPLTGGAYIEGINNLYEFDCGNLSGWMYSVNGEFPNCGCSDYKVSEGDSIKVVYSCNLGEDVGNIFRG